MVPGVKQASERVGFVPMRSFKKFRIRLHDPESGRSHFTFIDLWGPADETRWLEIGRSLYGGTLPGLKAINSSPQTSVQLADQLSIPGTYYIKRFFMRDRLDCIKHIFRHARAVREWRGCKLAAAAGIKVPEVCCVLVKRRCGIVQESSIISKAVQDSKSLREYYLEKRWSPSASDQNRKKALIIALAREVAAWHRSQLCHGDMHWENVLCKDNDGTLDFIWIDNERTQKLKRTYHQASNIAEHNNGSEIVLQDRLIFWKHYCKALDLKKKNRQALLQRAIRLTKPGRCADSGSYLH